MVGFGAIFFGYQGLTGVWAVVAAEVAIWLQQKSRTGSVPCEGVCAVCVEGVADDVGDRVQVWIG